MKTAISIPDDLFQAADEVAHRVGVSRSHLYATALAEYVAKLQSDGVTERLNAVYATEASRLEPGLLRAQMRTLERTDW